MIQRSQTLIAVSYNMLMPFRQTTHQENEGIHAPEYFAVQPECQYSLQTERTSSVSAQPILRVEIS
jgi:hypothetical protein